MSVTSINTNLAAFYAQQNISTAQDAVTLSVARLSSGNAIQRASDNVAGLAIGTTLQTNVATLQVAQQNVSQGSSLLQVADGALQQITDILQRQQELATQAASGSLTNTERGFLDQEFQALSSETNSLVSQTNFNGLNLIDGTLSQQSNVTSTSTQATAGTASLTFTTNPASSSTIIINGVTLTAGTDFTVGNDIAATVGNIASVLNDPSSDTNLNAAQILALGQATYSAQGNTLNITARTGGTLGGAFSINTTGTATAYSNSSIGAQYGGSNFELFNGGFSSATSAVATTSGSVTTSVPFAVGDTITAQVVGSGGTSSAKTLYTIASGDSLQSIVNGINASSSSTGVTATLVYQGPTNGYNIRINDSSATNPMIIGLGTHYDGASYTNGVAYLSEAGTASASAGQFFEGNGQLTNALASNIYVADKVTTVAATTVAGVSTATPFLVGDTVTAQIGSGPVMTLYTVASNDTLTTIADGINAQANKTGVYATIVGSANAYNLELYYADPTGAASFTFSAGQHGGAAASAHVNTASATLPLNEEATYGLQGGLNNGLNSTSTSATGTVGDSILTGLAQNAAKVQISFPDIDASSLTASANFGSDGSHYITVAGENFYFTTSTSGNAPNEIVIGSTLQQTLDNAVSTINSYASSDAATGAQAYQLNQMKVSRDGNSLVFEGLGLNNVYAIGSSSASSSPTYGSIAASGTITSATVTNSGSLDNASTTFGVDATGISNSAFMGTLSGFTATYDSANTADLSIKVGNYTYTATHVNTNPTSNTTVRFYSNTLADGSNGGYFDIQMAANDGMAIASQADANTVADHLNAAFSSLSFNQERNVSSYQGTQTIVANGTVIGSLVGSKVAAQLSNFSNAKVSAIAVTAPTGSNSNAQISLTINGEQFVTSPTLGSQLGANQTYRLVSTTNANDYVDFTTGNSTINLSSTANAEAVQSALQQAFGAGAGSSSLSFQVGTSASDTLNVSIANVSTSALFNGQSLDLLTQADAQTAGTAITTAINSVTAVRASVGALQESFNYASANLSSSVQNQDAARSQFLDTNIASESTNFATEQVKLQAGISTLAQANQQLQNLLKLLG